MKTLNISIFIPIIFFVLTWNAFGQENNCPAYPATAGWDTNCYIPANSPDPDAVDRQMGKLYLPEASFANKYGQPLHKSHIPDNRPHWALGIAHAWNYSRNINKQIKYPKISYWMATPLQESEWACDKTAKWGANTSWPLTGTPVNIGDDGCFQIEGVNNGSAYGALIQYYPLRFRKNEHPNLIGGDNFVTAALVKAYYDLFTERIAEYRWGWNYMETVENTCEPYAFEKLSASAYNAGIYAFQTAKSFMNNNSCYWTGLPATRGGYATMVADLMSVLENNTSYPVSTFSKAGSSFDGYYNEPIKWDDVLQYLDDLDDMYWEIDFPKTVIPKAQAAFVAISGSTSTPVNYMDIGPVIDAVILALPREDAIAPAQIIDGAPIGPNGVKCSGDIVPASHIEPQSHTKFCEGLSITLDAIIDGGGGNSPTYKWFEAKTGKTVVGTEAFLTVTPKEGVYTYSLEVCNEKGCNEANCDITIEVEDCGGCGMTLKTSTTKTPCKGMPQGTVNVDISGGNNSNDYEIQYDGITSAGPVTGSTSVKSSSGTVTNIPDGSYNIIVVDKTDENCKAFSSVKIGYDVEINEQMDGSVVDVKDCIADLEGNLVELPAPCTFEVRVAPALIGWPFPTDTTLIENGWENWVSAVVHPSSSGAQTFQANNFGYQWGSNPSDKADMGIQYFTMNTGDHFDLYTQVTYTPGSAKNQNSYIYQVWDETNTKVAQFLAPVGAADLTTPYLVGSYEVTCPYTPGGYTYDWTPAVTNQIDLPKKTSGKANVPYQKDVDYVVKATSTVNPICVLVDTITVTHDKNCAPKCNNPGTVTLDQTGTLNLCDPISQAIKTTVTGSGNFTYELYKAGSLESSNDNGNFTLTDKAEYYVLAKDKDDLTNTGCHVPSAKVTIAEKPKPVAPTFSASVAEACEGTTGHTYTINSIADADSYKWSYSSSGETINGSTESVTVNYAVGATSGNIEVIATNACGDSPKTTVAVKITTQDNPTITITSDKTTICAGGEVNFSIDNQTNEGTSPTYDWLVNGTSSGDTGTTFKSSTLGDGDKVSVEMTSNASCVSTNKVKSNEITINHSIPLTPTVSIKVDQNNVCIGTEVTFNIDAQTNEGTSPTYEWFVGSTSSGTDPTFKSNTLKNGDQVTVKMTSNEGCIKDNPATSDPIVMVITDPLVPSITITSNKKIICDGESVDFSIDQEENQGSFPTYQWKSSEQGNLGTNNTLSLSNLKDGEIITVEMTSDLSCVAPQSVTSNGVEINVTTQVAPDVEIAATGATTICNGEKVTIDITKQEGSGNTPTFDWLVNGTSSGETGNQFVSTTLKSGDKVSVKMTSSSSCAVPNEDTSDEITFTVGDPVTPTIAIKVDQNLPVCEDSELSFSIDSQTHEGVNPSYDWLVNSASSGETGTTFKSSSLKNGDIVSVKMTVEETCVTSNEATSNTVAIQTSQPVLPSVVISTPNTTICAGDNVTFSIDDSEHEGTTPSYDWLVNGTSSGETGTNYSSTGIADGDKISLKMTSSVGCVQQSEVTSNEIVMTVTNQVDPSVAIEIEGGISNVCNGEEVIIKVTGHTATSSASVFTWKVNGSAEGTTGDTFKSTTLKTGDLVTVESSNLTSCATKSTAESDAVSITIVSPFTPSLIISSVKNDVCEGEDIELEITPGEVGISPSYEWFVNNGPTGITTTSLKNTDVSLQNGDQITAQVTVAEKCVIGSQIASSNTESIQLTALVTPTVSITSLPLSVCEQSLVVLSVGSKSNEGSGANYVWKSNGTSLGKGETYSYTPTSSGKETITVELTSSITCVTQETVTSLPQELQVDAIEKPVVSLATKKDVICSGKDHTVIATATHSNATYEWFLNGVLSSETGNEFPILKASDGDYVEVISQSSSACKHPTTSSASANISLQVAPKSSPKLVVAETKVCEGAKVELEAYYNLGTVNPKIEWKRNGVVLGEGIQTYTLDAIQKGQAGKYQVQVTDDVCGVDADEVEIEVLSKPTIVVGGDHNKTVLEEESVTFEAIVSNGTDIRWQTISGDVLSIESSYTFIPTESTIYNLVAWNEEESCNTSVPASVLVVERVKIPNVFTPNGDGAHEVWEIESIEDYPNARVQIFTKWGQKVYQTFANYAENPWDGKHNGKETPVGVYYYIIELNSKVSELNVPLKGEIHIIR